MGTYIIIWSTKTYLDTYIPSIWTHSYCFPLLFLWSPEETDTPAKALGEAQIQDGQAPGTSIVSCWDYCLWAEWSGWAEGWFAWNFITALDYVINKPWFFHCVYVSFSMVWSFLFVSFDGGVVVPDPVNTLQNVAQGVSWPNFVQFARNLQNGSDNIVDLLTPHDESLLPVVCCVALKFKNSRNED